MLAGSFFKGAFAIKGTNLKNCSGFYGSVFTGIRQTQGGSECVVLLGTAQQKNKEKCHNVPFLLCFILNPIKLDDQTLSPLDAQILQKRIERIIKGYYRNISRVQRAKFNTRMRRKH